MASTRELVQYSEKSFVVFGDTKAIKGKLKELGGKYNRNLVDPRTGDKSPGWVFSHKKHTLVAQELSTPIVVNSTKNTFVKSQKSHVQKTEKTQGQKSQGATKIDKEETKVQKPQVPEIVNGPYFKALEYGMCRELAQKYQEYFNKKKKIQDSGRACQTQDSTRSRVYDAEIKYYHMHPDIVDPMTEVEMITFFNMVIRSTVYSKLTKNKPVIKFHDYLTSKLLGGKEIAGNANNNVVNISRNCGLNKRVILHELSHTCDNPHHDIKFRQDHVTLVKAFLGKKHGSSLAKCYTMHKLVSKVPEKIMEPQEWLKNYEKVSRARKMKK